MSLNTLELQVKSHCLTSMALDLDQQLNHKKPQDGECLGVRERHARKET